MLHSLSLSLCGEKPNLADGEEGARATKCCRSTDEKQNPTESASRSRTIAPSTPGLYDCIAQTFHSKHELRRSLWVLCLWRPEHVPGSSSGYAGDQGPYYPPGMHSSYGPQVGPSASARFNYEDPIMQSISDLSNQITTLSTQQ